METRSLSTIAQEIYKDRANWKGGWDFAFPYLSAMMQLDKITDNYILDSGRSIVCYFLSNASQWKGEKAKAIKKELHQMLKQK